MQFANLKKCMLLGEKKPHREKHTKCIKNTNKGTRMLSGIRG